MSERPEKATKEELERSALGWGTPFLKKGGLLWLLNDMLSEAGDDIGDGPAATKFRDALEDTVISLERERDYWKEQSRKWCDDFTKLEPELRRVVELAKQCKTERDEALEVLRELVRIEDTGMGVIGWEAAIERARAILEAKP